MIVDTNVHLSRWPFRRLAGDETSDLVARLRARDVTQAWAGSFDGIFQKDLAAVNERLVVQIAGAIWMVAGIAYGAWRTKGFRGELVDFDIPASEVAP